MTDKDENEFDVTKFFSDPKHAREADIMRKSVRHVFAEVANEEELERKKQEDENAKKKPVGFIEALFGLKK